MTEDEAKRKGKADRLYERYGRPLEARHLGDFVAITEDGNVVVNSDLVELTRKSSMPDGPETFIFKIGERVVGSWR